MSQISFEQKGFKTWSWMLKRGVKYGIYSIVAQSLSMKQTVLGLEILFRQYSCNYNTLVSNLFSPNYLCPNYFCWNHRNPLRHTFLFESIFIPCRIIVMPIILVKNKNNQALADPQSHVALCSSLGLYLWCRKQVFYFFFQNRPGTSRAKHGNVQNMVSKKKKTISFTDNKSRGGRLDLFFFLTLFLVCPTSYTFA